MCRELIVCGGNWNMANDTPNPSKAGKTLTLTGVTVAAVPSINFTSLRRVEVKKLPSSVEALTPAGTTKSVIASGSAALIVTYWDDRATITKKNPAKAEETCTAIVFT
ncbi:hypothetical protein Mapa_009084 [Marchantia paleacea]|nr:hypothetical protein Mapa_009084 [Marchantia paleacea]